MAPTDEGRHGGRGCYPRCGPRPEGVEKEDKADPYEIGKKATKVSKVRILVTFLTRKEVVKPVCGFHYILEIFLAKAITSFLQTR